MKTTQGQLTAAIEESLAAFKQPQPTRIVYFDTLRNIQNRFPNFDRWKMRVELLAMIEQKCLAEDPGEIARLLCHALKEVEEGFEEQREYMNL